MKSYSLSELNRQSGEVVDSAMIAPVSLTKRGKPKLVVMNAVTYEMLKRGKAHTIENAPDEVHQLLIEGLNEMLSES